MWLWRVVWCVCCSMAVNMESFVALFVVLWVRGAVAPVCTWLGGSS